MKKFYKLFSFVALLFLANDVKSQVSLLEWRLSQQYPGEALGANNYLNGQETSVSSNYRPTGVKQSVLLRGEGLNNTKGQSNSFAAGFNQTDNTNYNNAVGNNNYMEFVLEPEEGYAITLSSFYTRLRSNQGTSTSALFFQLAYSIDNAAFQTIGEASGIDYSTQTSDFNIDVSAIPVITESSKITFRLYYYRPFTTNSTAYVAIGRRDTGVDPITFSSLTVSGTVESTTPVTFGKFSVTKNIDGNLLEWNTLTEKDNSHFEVFRSLNGSDYQSITSIDGKGTTSNPENYSYLDRFTGNAYYKLKQVDLNGYSKEYFAYVKGIALKPKLSVFENGSQVQVNLEGFKKSQGDLKIRNIAGQILYRRTVVLDEEIQSFNFDLEKGIYVVSLETAEDVVREKFIK